MQEKYSLNKHLNIPESTGKQENQLLQPCGQKV